MIQRCEKQEMQILNFQKSLFLVERIGGYDVMKELLGAENPATTPLWKISSLIPLHHT